MNSSQTPQTIGELIPDDRMQMIMSSALVYAMKHFDDFTEMFSIPEELRPEVLVQMEQITYAATISAISATMGMDTANDVTSQVEEMMRHPERFPETGVGGSDAA